MIRVSGQLLCSTALAQNRFLDLFPGRLYFLRCWWWLHWPLLSPSGKKGSCAELLAKQWHMHSHRPITVYLAALFGCG